MVYLTRSTSQMINNNTRGEFERLMFVMLQDKKGLYTGHYERRVIERAFGLKSSNYTYWLGKRILYLKNNNSHAFALFMFHLTRKFGMPKW